MQDSQKTFECIARSVGYPVEKRATGEYSPFTDMAWRLWQAAEKLEAREAELEWRRRHMRIWHPRSVYDYWDGSEVQEADEAHQGMGE